LLVEKAIMNTEATYATTYAPNTYEGDLYALMHYYQQMGIDYIFDDIALNHLDVRSQLHQALETPKAQTQATSQIPTPPPPYQTELLSQHLEHIHHLCQHSHNIEDLARHFQNIDYIFYKKAAKNFLFFEGNINSKIVMINLSSDYDDEQMQKILAGDKGILLEKIFSFIGLNLREDILLVNIVPWLVPGGADPNIQSLQLSLPFTQRLLALQQPKLTLLLGGVVTNLLLEHNEAISALHGKIIQENSYDYMPLLPPKSLLMSPIHKPLMWRDMLKIQKVLMHED
jgi:uracil-DNA glycosylase family 4